MIRKWATRAWMPGLIVGFGLVPQFAIACSCFSGSLENQYKRSDNVFAAIITGGSTTRELVGNSAKLKTRFEVTESFKGSIPFDHFNSHADGSSCGISLQVGVEYLIFAPDSGDIGLCSGIVAISGTPDVRRQVGKNYVDALRSFTSGKSGALADPWFFFEEKEFCRIVVNFPYADVRFPASLRVLYRKLLPETDVAESDPLQLQADSIVLTVSVPGRDDLRNFPLSLTVDDDSHIANWKKKQYSAGRYYLHGDDVVEIIAALEHADALRIESAHPTYGNVKADVHTSNAGDSLSRMLACIQSN